MKRRYIIVRRLNLKESFEDEGYFDELEIPTEKILNNLKSDLYKAISDVMFEYRDFDIYRETLDTIIRKNMDRFYDANWM